MQTLEPYDAEALDRWCRTHAVRLAVLHGSRAEGSARARSDLDLAVLFEAGRMDRRRFVEIVPDLAEIFPDRDVDPLLLNEAGSLVSMEVAQKGRVLWARDETAWSAFVSLALRRYADDGKLRRSRNRGSGRILERLGHHA